MNLWIFDRDAGKKGRHFHYSAGNQKSGQAAKVDLNETQWALLRGGAMIAWMEDVNRLILPYFSWLDTLAATPESSDTTLRIGIPRLSTQPLVDSDAHKWWTWVREDIPLGRVQVDDSHTSLRCRPIEITIIQHQRRIEDRVHKDRAVRIELEHRREMERQQRLAAEQSLELERGRQQAVKYLAELERERQLGETIVVASRTANTIASSAQSNILVPDQLRQPVPEQPNRRKGKISEWWNRFLKGS